MQQALTIIAMTIIAGMYGAEVIGIFAEQLSLGILIGALLSLKIEVKLPLMQSKKSVFEIVNGAAGFNIFCTIIFISLCLLFDLNDFIPAFCLGSLVNFISIFSYQSISYNQFGRIALSKIVLPVIFFLSALAFNIFTPKAESNFVVISYIFGLIASVLIFNPKFSSFRPITPKKLLNIFYKHKDNTFFTSSSIFLDLLKDFLIIYCVSRYFSAEMAGIYFLATKIFIAPATLIAGSISQVLYKDLSDLVVNKASIYLYLQKKLFWSFILGMLLIFSIFITINYFIDNFLIEEWIKIKEISFPFMIITSCIYCMTIISILIFVLNLQRFNVFFTCIYFLISLLPFAFGIYFNGTLIEILMWQAFTLLFYSSIYIGWILNKILIYEKAFITHSSRN